MSRSKQVPEVKRRIPRQTRAAETVAAILEGAAQILEAGGLAGFTTNAVAERAGVSIGTLYQYFSDKNEILRAIAERELRKTLANVADAMRDDGPASALPDMSIIWKPELVASSDQFSSCAMSNV